MNAQHEVRSRTRRAAALTVLLALLTGLLAQVPASASGLLFSDGFETGDLSRWTASSGMTVQQQVVGSGAFSARATATGGAAYAYKALSTAQSDLYYDGRFDVISSANNNVSLMRLRTSTAGAILTVYRRADGYLYYYNEVTGTTALGPQVSTGVWHELEVHALVNGTSGQVQVWLDGSPVASMTKTDNLGTTPTGRVYVGEPATGRTFDVAFDSEVLSTSADVTAPTTPTAVQASANGANQVNVSWSASTDAVGVTGYTVYRNGAVLTTVPAGTTAYADSSVLPATTYTYAVDAYDGAGNHSALSSTATATTASLDVTPPSVPAGLTATAVSATRVDLAWSASTDNVGVTGYTVYRDGAVLTTVNGSTTSWSDTGASPSTTYSYAVDAFDAGGNHSASSSAQKVTTPAPPDTTAPSVPGGLTVTGSASNSVSLSWTAATDDTGVTGYTVYRDGALLATVAGTATTYVDGTVAPETRYGYAVDAFDAAGNHSAATAAVTVTTPAAVDTVPPAAPTGLTATAVSSAKVHLSWTASTDNVSVTGYTVYRNGSPLATTDGQTTAWDDTTVAASTTYTYTVDAFDAGGNHSSQTAGVDATTPAPPDTTAPSVPGSPAATAVGSGRVDVTWTASTDDTGVTGYTVYRGGTAVATVGGSTTSFSDTGLTASTTYSYTVDAFDAAGNRSARTAPVSATTAAPADTTAPTVPTGLTGQAVSPTRVDLSWSAASDNVGVAGYTVYRGGAVLANVGAGFTSFSDSSVTHSTTYAYTVDAFDAAGNHSAASAGVSVTTPGTAFSDGFESGTTSAWTASTGMTVQRTVTHSGSYAARGTSTGAGTYVYRSFSPPLGDFFYDGWVQVVSQSPSTTLGLVRFRTPTVGLVFSIMRRTDGRLAYYNEVTKASTALGQMSAGSWHHLVAHVVVNGTASTVSLSMDGTTQLSKTDNLGTTAVGRVYVGDSATGSSWDLVVDDQTVSTSADTTPPSTPTSVAATGVGPRHVNVTWTGSTDNLAVAGYTVYRNGVAVGSVGPYVRGFADFSASPATSYGYTVAAFDTSGNASPTSASTAVTTSADGTPADPYVMAVGDTACDPTNGSFLNGLGTTTACRQRYTSDLAWNADPAAVLALGDEQYEVGSFAAFQQSYDPSWGRMPTITRPVPGNHEYLTAGGSGYYTYFGSAAGSSSKGYYSYDVGSWHVVALNGECSYVGGCGAGSAQDQWLQADLAAHSTSCTLAYWHEPRWSSGAEHGSDATYAQFWRDLYAAHADVVLNGHDHDYERFALQDDTGQVDTAHGIRELVVGTGGAEQAPLGTLEANSEVFHTGSFGVLKLTLHPGSYDWQFVNDGSSTFTDAGSEGCR